MNKLKAGFGRVEVNPKLGTPISGYFHERLTEGYLDNLEANVLALSDGKETVLFIAVDNCGFNLKVQLPYREAISKELNIPMKNIIVSSTHTHTGPVTKVDSGYELVDEYKNAIGKYRNFSLLCDFFSDFSRCFRLFPPPAPVMPHKAHKTHFSPIY